jgi:uncharacterized protein
MTVPTIDTHEFTRRGDSAAGREPVAALERLASMLLAPDGTLDWRLGGRSELGADGARKAFLHLGVAGTVRMRCVRCLEPIEVALEVGRDYRLVATEEQAEREDADEESVDVLVASRRFDLGALVEDEAIMALPAAPRHADCTAPAAAAAQAPTGAFSRLADLRSAAGPAGDGGSDGTAGRT